MKVNPTFPRDGKDFADKYKRKRQKRWTVPGTEEKIEVVLGDGEDKKEICCAV